MRRSVRDLRIERVGHQLRELIQRNPLVAAVGHEIGCRGGRANRVRRDVIAVLADQGPPIVRSVVGFVGRVARVVGIACGEIARGVGEAEHVAELVCHRHAAVAADEAGTHARTAAAAASRIADGNRRRHEP